MAINKQHFWIDREHERITTEIACQVRPVGGDRKTVIIINLSAGGLKFSCDRTVFNLLLPEDQRIPGQVSGVEIEIYFQLQAAGRKKPLSIRAQARLIHTERLAQDSFTLGAQFIALRDTDIRGIENYMQQIDAQTERL
ncbi:MAG TPA: PilZ domain-containing protein [Gammaproteobacteria bacterium]|nr:PilZ domain-containing protein [Gammaproteobacteria bacterium]